MVLGRMRRRQGLVYSQDWTLCPQGRERLLVCVGHCRFSLGSCWDGHPAPCPVGDTARDRVILGCDILLQFSSQEVLPLNPSEPASHARSALLPCPYLLPAPGWSWMWSHAPKNHQHQETTGTPSNSVPCQG